MMENAELMGTPWSMETFGVKSDLHLYQKLTTFSGSKSAYLSFVWFLVMLDSFTKKDIFSKENDLN